MLREVADHCKDQAFSCIYNIPLAVQMPWKKQIGSQKFLVCYLPKSKPVLLCAYLETTDGIEFNKHKNVSVSEIYI